MIINRQINGISFGVNIEKSAGLVCSKRIADLIDNDIYEFVELLYAEKNEYTPMIATWEITNCCNYNCPFCYINTSKKPQKQILTLDSIKPAIDTLVEKGLLLVYLTGGEVLSVPDFQKIYLYLKHKGVFIVILTNLSLLSKEHLDLFEKYPPLRITTSIYGLTEEQFTRVTGQEYTVAKKVLENILKLKNRGVLVTCQTPVNKHTLNDIVDISDWCFDHSIRFTCNNELTDSYYNESRCQDYINDDEFLKIKAKIRQIEPIKTSKPLSVNKKFGYRHYFDCVSGKHTFAVSSNLHIRPCFNIWESDLTYFDGSQSMERAFEEMKKYINIMRTKVLEECTGCNAVQLCGECVYTRLKHKNNLAAYIIDACKQNQQKLQRLIDHS